MNQHKRIQCLLRAMCQPRTFYLLGAGASYGLVPVTEDMRSIIESEYHSVGVYPTTPLPPSPLFKRVIGEIFPFEQDIQKLILAYMSPAALDLLTQRALWIPNNNVIPPQYAVFEVVGSPATLCNFNLDGLASLHCGHRHSVIEMHGRIDRPWLEHPNYRELRDAAVIYGIQTPHLTPKLLPQPEPADTASHLSYMRAKQLFHFSHTVIILGYSFGQRSDGFDDTQSLEFFVSLMKRYPRPVFVVSPTPHDLAEMLRDKISSHHVYGISLR